jgi:hypothetical protein
VELTPIARRESRFITGFHFRNGKMPDGKITIDQAVIFPSGIFLFYYSGLRCV